MVGNSHLAAEHDIAAESAAPGNTDLAGYQTMLADDNVVGKMDLVVQLRSGLDHGISERGPVDGAVRADLHVIADHHAAYLGNLMMDAAFGNKAEAVAPDHGTCVDDDAVSDGNAFPDGDIRVYNAVIAQD